MQFQEPEEQVRVRDILEVLHESFEDIIAAATVGRQPSDYIRIVITHEDFHIPIATRTVHIQTMSAQEIMRAIQKVLNSHEDLRLNRTFRVDITVIPNPVTQESTN